MGGFDGIQLFGGSGVSKTWVNNRLKTYYNKDAVLIEKFNQLLDWTVTKTNSNWVVENYNNGVQTGQGIRMYTPTGGLSTESATITSNRVFDFSQVDGFWIIVDNKYISKSNLKLYLSPLSNFGLTSGYFEVTLFPGVCIGLTSVYLSKNMFTVAGGSPSFDNPILSWRIRAENATTVRDNIINGVAVGGGTPKVLFWFDDAWESAYTLGHTLARKRNIPLNHAVAPGWIGDDGFMTMEQLQDISANSNDYIGLHDTEQWGLDTSRIAIVRQQLIDTGLSDGKHAVAPNNDMGTGYNAPVTKAAMEACGILTNAAGANAPFLPQYQDLLSIPRISLGNTSTTSAGAITAIDKAIAGGGTAVFCLHRIGSAATSMDLAEAEYTTILDYVDKKRSAGLIDAVNIADWYAGL